MFDRLCIYLLFMTFIFLDETGLYWSAFDGNLIQTKELVSQGEDVNKRSGWEGK